MLKNIVNVGQKPVGPDTAPYIIAEAGSNFDQDLDKARKLIDIAAEAGANAVKFQLFSADTLYPNKDGLHHIFKSLELNPDWLPGLKAHSEERGLDFLASAFDAVSVDTLEKLNVCAFKIASSETTNHKLLLKLALIGKPLILSTGMCDMVDVQQAVEICLAAGNTQVILLQCGAVYPLDIGKSNLSVIKSFAERFRCPVGFSDHTLDSTAAITAVGVGATIFEKHFTNSKQDEGPDHFYALEPNELKTYVNNIHQAFEALGSKEKQMLLEEKELGRRDGLYFSKSLPSGHVITKEDINVERPAKGMRARYFETVIGATLCEEVRDGQPVDWNLISIV